MLLLINWEGCIYLGGFVLIGYYAYVLYKYFPRERQRVSLWLSIRQKEASSYEDEETDEDVPGLKVAVAMPATEVGMMATGPEVIAAKTGPEWKAPMSALKNRMELSQELIGKVKQWVHKASREGVVREELIVGLQVLLNEEKYRFFNQGSFREAMVQIIQDNMGDDRFTEMELNRLWEQVTN